MQLNTKLPAVRPGPHHWNDRLNIEFRPSPVHNFWDWYCYEMDLLREPVTFECKIYEIEFHSCLGWTESAITSYLKMLGYDEEPKDSCAQTVVVKIKLNKVAVINFII